MTCPLSRSCLYPHSWHSGSTIRSSSLMRPCSHTSPPARRACAAPSSQSAPRPPARSGRHTLEPWTNKGPRQGASQCPTSSGTGFASALPPGKENLSARLEPAKRSVHSGRKETTCSSHLRPAAVAHVCRAHSIPLHGVLGCKWHSTQTKSTMSMLGHASQTARALLIWYSRSPLNLRQQRIRHRPSKGPNASRVPKGEVRGIAPLQLLQ